MSVTEQIRSACAAVAAGAQHVKIDESRLASYATSLPLERLKSPQLDSTRHYVGHGEATAAFFVTLDAINFGSGYFPHLHKRPGMSGYFTIASCLNDHFRAHGPLSADELAGLTGSDCARLFQQTNPDQAIAELMGLFAGALNDLGKYLQSEYDRSFTSLISSADQSAQRLIAILARMPFFNDVQTYRGRRVPFFKRAQLTAADLALALGGEGLGRFTDLDQLTIFADNLVPHVLRIDGILRYDPDLAARIDREELIAPGSEEEIELRACAVHSVERMVQHLRSGGRAVNAMGIDYLLWNRGQEPSYKQARPRHRTRTVFY